MSPTAIEVPADSDRSLKPIQVAVDASLSAKISMIPDASGSSASAPSPTVPVATSQWVTVCKQGDLIPGRGVAALVNNHQYALFLTNQGELFAVDNRDPFCDANVMARGIIGDRNGEPKVASPMLKQTFSLKTGICFEDPTITISTYPIRTSPTQTIEIQVPIELTPPS